ncbi:isopentenyl-diphosphate delta-isomerase [Ruminococcus sp. OM05-10BH]|nr:isopentenyl-diphosphate delta-isomerase [Ruminococcus sp. OM05-10BH]
MNHASDLKKQLLSIHRKSYPAYKSLKGVYDFGEYTLSIDHVQGDPFASPSHVTIRIPFSVHRFPKDLYKTPETKAAFEDHLLRRFASQIRKFSFQAKGSGKSGLLSVSSCGQEILSRTACEICTSKDSTLIFRFHIGFPANGRTINATELEKILFDFLPSCVERGCLYRTCDKKKLTETFELAEDQTFIRKEIHRLGLAAFVADGSILPRQSGVSDLPMKDGVAFSSPESLRVTLHLPHRGSLSGMGIPRGITLIVGGGYHGKSTLLKALETGVYPHIAGDGREYVITDESAVKLRSEDGRIIKNVDISLFINDLPNGRDTTSFSTLDASGSTSQAAGTVESIEAESRLFLIDEDTSATNFMVRDTFMQQVISREKEPITPFLERARDLYEKAGISTILVAVSSGAFFHIADTVIQMDCYHPVDITEKVKTLCKDYPLSPSSPAPFRMPSAKRIFARPSKKQADRRDGKIRQRSKDVFSIGKEEVDLRYVEQIKDSEQTASLALLLGYAKDHYSDGKKTIPEIADLLYQELKQNGYSGFFRNSYIPGGYAIPRLQEIHACLNRYRGESR